MGALTLVVYPAAAGSEFSVSEADDTHTLVHASQDVTSAMTIDLTPVRRRTVLRVRADMRVTGAARGGVTITPATDCAAFDAGTADFFYDVSARVARVRIPAPTGPPAGTTRIALTP